MNETRRGLSSSLYEVGQWADPPTTEKSGRVSSRQAAEEAVQAAKRLAPGDRYPTSGRVSSRRHDWKFIGGTFDWHLYRCQRCGREEFPTIFGFMPFWKRCRA